METGREYLLKYLDADTPDYFEHNAGKRRTRIEPDPEVELVPVRERPLRAYRDER